MTVGVIALILVYVFIYNKPHPDFEAIKPDFTLNAADLYNSYITDRKSSEEKFNGKVIELQKTLSKVEVTDSTVIAVFVFNQGMFGDEGIRCSMLKNYHDETRSLLPQSRVRIKGFCSGYNETDLILEQSSIIK